MNLMHLKPMLKVLTTLFLAFALFGCLTLATMAVASTTHLQPLNTANPCQKLLNDNGPALLPTPFLIGQKLKQNTDEALNLTSAKYSAAWLTNGSYPNKLPLNTTNLQGWHCLEKATATLHPATLVALKDYDRQMNYYKRRQNCTSTPK